MPVKKIKKQPEEKEFVNEFDKSLKVIRSMVLKNKGFVERPITTGYSYFKGNVRLLKLVYSAGEIVLEINTELPEELAKLPGMKYYTRQEAYNEHLGTVRYKYETQTADHIKDIVKASLENFKEQEKKRLLVRGVI
ncbi:hypothetical protein [Thermosipho sp. (in: thermotogales)]|jgi:hypothetical protein|uniref:hypothetical protein n=1 Tax=Thermosipho sp. (in: thermotogales) TaxID=1968895 RepID=UPI00257E0DBF|nr:hypothetical protein [Thermosipho sp. (in: thermotogales)]MBZ4649222.1 hypothetical protein [Thermosipho sp. (in: thermotogales)]